MTVPQKIIGSLGPTNNIVFDRRVRLSIKQVFTLMLHNRYSRFELTFELLRYCLGGDRPSQTSNHELFL